MLQKAKRMEEGSGAGLNISVQLTVVDLGQLLNSLDIYNVNVQ